MPRGTRKVHLLLLELAHAPVSAWHDAKKSCEALYPGDPVGQSRATPVRAFALLRERVEDLTARLAESTTDPQVAGEIVETLRLLFVARMGGRLEPILCVKEKSK